MDSQTVKRLVLPATLAVTTLVVAPTCKNGPHASDYCEDITRMSTCESEPGCGWNEEFGECVNTCHMIETQEECEAIERCIWELGSNTDTGGSETGGDGFCTEPFT